MINPKKILLISSISLGVISSGFIPANAAELNEKGKYTGTYYIGCCELDSDDECVPEGLGPRLPAIDTFKRASKQEQRKYCDRCGYSHKTGLINNYCAKF